MFLCNVFYLKGGEVDSEYRWEQCKKIIIDGDSYTIRRDIFVEILLQAGADPNGNIECQEKLPIQYPIEHGEPEEGKVISGMESIIGALLVEYGANVPDDLLKQNEKFSTFSLPLIWSKWLEKNKEKLKQTYMKLKQTYILKVSISLIEYDFDVSESFNPREGLSTFGPLQGWNEWLEREYEVYIRESRLKYNALYNPAKEAISKAKKNGQKIVNRAKIVDRTDEKTSLTKDLCEILGLEDEKIGLEEDEETDEEKDEISLKNMDRISLTNILYEILELEDEEISIEEFPNFSKKELFELLLDDPKLDINRKDSKGLTLLQYAREANLPEIIKVLEKHGATEP